jgi:hypothetical protein
MHSIRASGKICQNEIRCRCRKLRKRRLWSQNIKRYKRNLFENSFKILHKPDLVLDLVPHFMYDYFVLLASTL